MENIDVSTTVYSFIYQSDSFWLNFRVFWGVTFSKVTRFTKKLDRINLNSNLNIMFWGAEGRVGFEATKI